ncbi:putative Aromatic-amino-acid aminotransferase 1 [Hypsibius exemplaris]|uniref:Aromatic-amino-acid aminotransferase 1 n=1 Tax=Hypsibius exemplaris TaxID=2072580 RepID=A0A1W0WYN1_HYPEX|nr:putative Aromatic-amino-acid aminotransferase 1 [Hypsibius exemplaris]
MAASQAARKPALHEYDGAGDYDPDNYNFHIGAPHQKELLECSKIIESATLSLAKAPVDFRTSAFQYGREQGAEPVLSALAGFLSQEYQRPVDPENLMITAGASMAFTLVCTEFFCKYPGGGTPVVFVEHPTYFLVMNIAQDFGFHVEPIPTHVNGEIDFGQWAAVAGKIHHTTSPTSRPFKSMVYLVPTFRNPTGVTLTEETANKIHNFCVEQNLLIHCDDVYNILYYGEKPPVKLFPVGESNVISAGTFSKLLGPGLRVGWVEAPKEIISKLGSNGMVVSGGCVAQFSSFLIERAITSGDLTRHVKDLRARYTEKVRAISAALKAGLPESVKWTSPTGGYFVWIVLPEGSAEFITKELVPAAKAVGVRFGVGARSCPLRGASPCELGCPNALRLSLGHVTVDQIPEGIARLCKLLRDRFGGLKA